MIRRIDLHIGDCRTATTALQTALVTGGVARGIYPGRGLNHNELARALADGVPQKARELLGLYGQEAEEKGAERVVLSAEHLEFADPLVVAELLSDVAEVHVHALIRPHADAILSRYCEHIKLGDALGPLRKFADRMIERRRLHYAKRLRQWKTVFGAGFHADVFGAEGLAQLVERLGGDATNGLPRRNESLKLEELAFLRWTHLRLKDFGVKRGERGRFGRIVARSLVQREGPRGNDVYLPAGIAALVQQEFSEDARVLDREWFGGGQFTDAIARAEANAIDRPLQLQAELYFSAAELEAAERAARAMAELAHSATRDEILDVIFVPNTA